jgi:hypothetical protein
MPKLFVLGSQLIPEYAAVPFKAGNKFRISATHSLDGMQDISHMGQQNSAIQRALGQPNPRRHVSPGATLTRLKRVPVDADVYNRNVFDLKSADANDLSIARRNFNSRIVQYDRFFLQQGVSLVVSRGPIIKPLITRSHSSYREA